MKNDSYADRLERGFDVQPDGDRRRNDTVNFVAGEIMLQSQVDAVREMAKERDEQLYTADQMQRWNAQEYGDARAAHARTEMETELAETLAKASMQIYALKRELRNCVGFMEHVAMECGEGDTPKNFALAISRAHEVLK